MTKKGLLLLLFVILLTTDVLAGNTNDIGRVYVYENVNFAEDTRGKSFFLFSDVLFAGNHSDDIFLVNSHVTISGGFDGNIYCFFSEADITGRLQGQLVNFTSPLFLILVKLLIFLIIFSGRKSFFEQGSMTIVHEPLRVLRNGLLAYFICIALIFMFLISVVGFPIAVLILLLLYIFILLGEISLSIVIGYFILPRPNKTLSYANMMVGAIIISIVGYIPFVGVVAKYVLLPLLCLGMLSCCIMNGFIKKVFFHTPYRTLQGRTLYDPEIRNKLMDGDM